MSRVARPPSHRHIHEVKWLHTSLVSSQSPLIRRVIVIGVITYIHLFEEANGKMPEYKLYYFQSKGRAEVIRYIFAQAGQKYEDIRLNGDKWGELKPKTPWKCMPLLEVDGRKIGGSFVIARFLAERFGLSGEGDIERAEIAAAADAVYDLVTEMVKVFFEKDETKKEELKKDFTEKILPLKLSSFEEQIKRNGAPEGWLFTKKVTWADLALVNSFEWLALMAPDALKDFPGISKLADNVNNLSNIKKWIEERPKTAF